MGKLKPQRRRARREKQGGIEDIAKTIVDAAIKVHRALGPGLLESAYQQCLAYELRKRGLSVETEVELPLKYKDVQINVGYRIDRLVENRIVVENKTVEELAPIHQAQWLTYLKLRDCRLGCLLNWNVTLMKNGIQRMVNNR